MYEKDVAIPRDGKISKLFKDEAVNISSLRTMRKTNPIHENASRPSEFRELKRLDSWVP
jgi:hypothetical protein